MAEPFITLSSSDNSDTSVSDSYNDNSPLSTPPSTTHDTSRAEFHVKDLEAFAKDLQNAADRAFPNSSLTKPRYENISVVLLRWEDDEMNVEWELDDLEKVFRDYGFETQRWLIPRKNAHLKLMSKAVEIVEDHDGKDDLVIVYYAGHAFINTARQATWCCKSDPSYASLEWSAIQTLFEKAHFDVLLLLDCCAAASAAPRVGSAVTETIAACGFESTAPQPGRFSFTNSLIEVLEDWIDSPPFSAAMLHNRVLSVLKHERPERTQDGKRRKIECRRTPIHIMAAAGPTLPSIELGRRARMGSQCPTSQRASDTLQATGKTRQTDPTPTSAENTKQDHPQEETPHSTRKTYEQDSIHDIDGDDYEAPRVIISLALEKHQTLSSESCQKWLTCCPTLVQYAKVEAVYKSFSSLVLLSIPVLLWDLLPENPACSFVGYVTSPNLMSSNVEYEWPEQTSRYVPVQVLGDFDESRKVPTWIRDAILITPRTTPSNSDSGSTIGYRGFGNENKQFSFGLPYGPGYQQSESGMSELLSPIDEEEAMDLSSENSGFTGIPQNQDQSAINAARLAEVQHDGALHDTLHRHRLPNITNSQTPAGQVKDSGDNFNYQSGSSSKDESHEQSNLPKTGQKLSELTQSKGGVPLNSKGRKKRKDYPSSWGCPASQMKMKKRVLCVFDGPRRLWKDDMMANTDYEVRMKLADGRAYVTDLDVQTVRRADAFHSSTEDEKGPWIADDLTAMDLEKLMERKRE